MAANASFNSLDLLPLTQSHVSDIVRAYASAEKPRATSHQIAIAAAFAEGVPMYGIEMLGLLLDLGSPDSIPFRVQTAVDSTINSLSELQWRLLVVCQTLRESARQPVVAAALNVPELEFASALDGLECKGHLQSESTVLKASVLLANEAQRQLRPVVRRTDALRAADTLQSTFATGVKAEDLYASLRLLIVAGDEPRALELLNSKAGALARSDAALNITVELSTVRDTARHKPLIAILDETIQQIRAGAESKRYRNVNNEPRPHAATLPLLSPASLILEHEPASQNILKSTLADARDPNASPDARLSEAVTALMVASNLNDRTGLDAAHRAVNAVRHAKSLTPFYVLRADLIYFASIGDRQQALDIALALAQQSRVVSDIQLACKGLRNCAEAFSTFGDTKTAQALLLECRSLAQDLQYYSQIAWTDIRLADLCIESGDLQTAGAYLTNAAAIANERNLKAPLLVADLHLNYCWLALMNDDISSAQKSARFVTRKLQASRSGSAYWTVLTVKLACYRGKQTREMTRDFEALKASVDTRPFYPNEQQSLTALLLYAKHIGDQSAVSCFVRTQLPRIEKSGQRVWSFLSAHLAP